MRLRINLVKRNHILKGVALSCTIFAVLNEISWESIHTARMLTTETVGAVDNSCALEPPREPPLGTLPIIAASYPGSGSKMTWNLIEAITGFWTGDEWFLNGRTSENVVSIKTHYPHTEGRLIPYDVKIHGALLLIRHPMDAIPSYHNYIYEVENKLPLHSTRAPVDEWIPWRDLHFEEELMKWKESITYWMDAIPTAQRLVMFFEKIVDEETGPSEALKLSEFLGRTKNVNAVEQERASCVWRAIVRYDEIEVDSESAKNETLGRRILLEEKENKNKSSTIESDLSPDQLSDPLLVTDEVEQEQQPEGAGYLTVQSPQMNPQNLSLTTDQTQIIISDAEDPFNRIDTNALLPVEQPELEIPSLLEDPPVEKINNYRPNPASLRGGPKDKPFTAEQIDLVMKVVRELVDLYDGTELADYFSVYYIGRVYHSHL